MATFIIQTTNVDVRWAVSTVLFAIQSLLALVDERRRTIRNVLTLEQGPRFDVWQYAFDRVVAWWTYVLRVLSMLMFIFVLTAAIRIVTVGLMRNVMIPVGRPPHADHDSGNDDAKGKEKENEFLAALRDQAGWVLGVPLRPSFVMPYFVWIPLIVWSFSLAYGFVILKRPDGQRSPDAFHGAVDLWMVAMGSLVALCWTLFFSE